MPLIKYTALHPEGHEITETQLFPRGRTPEEILVAYEPLFKTASILSVEVLNPFVHEKHEWVRQARMGERIYYQCSVCDCESFTTWNNFRGESKVHCREGKWKSPRFEVCRDPLKEMPPSTKLFQ